MLQNKGLGKVSYRGIGALGIGLVFIWLALNPQHFNDDTPPFFFLVIMFLAGVGGVYGGIASLRFVWRRSYLVRTNASVAAEICVLEDDDDERGAETVHVRINGRCQALRVDHSGAVRNYVDGKVRWGEVWLDPNGRVHAIAISGEHFNTLTEGRQIPAECFGGKE